MKNPLKILFAVAITALFAAVSFAADAPKPKVIAAAFHADWCGSCKTLEPKLAEAKRHLTGKPVLLAKLDLTDDASKQQAAMLSHALGIAPAFEKHAPKTGFVLLIDAETREVVGRVNSSDSPSEITTKIEKALKG